MVRTRSGMWACLWIAIFTVSALGCASSGVSKAIGPDDLPSLAGRWVGTIIFPSGDHLTGTMDLSPNGDYVTQASWFIARGRAQVKDGALLLVPTYTAGSIGDRLGERSSVAHLSVQQDGAETLTGAGHSDAGPFSFEVVRQK